MREGFSHPILKAGIGNGFVKKASAWVTIRRYSRFTVAKILTPPVRILP